MPVADPDLFIRWRVHCNAVYYFVYGACLFQVFSCSVSGKGGGGGRREKMGGGIHYSLSCSPLTERLEQATMLMINFFLSEKRLVIWFRSRQYMYLFENY